MTELMSEGTASGGTVTLATIRTAITGLQELNMAPTAVVLAPADWEDVEAEAVHAYAANANLSPNEALQSRLYGLPVQVSNSITTGTAIVGDFLGSAQLYRTGGASITVHDSQPRTVGEATVAAFMTNEVTFRAEMRAEIAVTRPEGFAIVGAAS